MLWDKTCDELKEILGENKLSKTYKVKQDLVDRVFTHCNIIPTGSETIYDKIQNMNYRQKAIHHQFYRKNFNAVDLLDKQFNSTNFTYGINNYRTKLILSLLTMLTNQCLVFILSNKQY